MDSDVGAWADHLSKIARLSFYACAGVCVGVCPCSVLARACAVQPLYISEGPDVLLYRS